MPSRNTRPDDDEHNQTLTRSVAIWHYQERWLAEMNMVDDEHLSTFVRALLELARNGKVDTAELLKTQKQTTSIERAARYMKAKEAGMAFEDDVNECLQTAVAGKPGYKVIRGRVHKSDRIVFVADFSIERAGEVVFSVVCKSSSRADRLQLALAEAMIGQQHTSRPVLTVCPYFTDEGEPVRAQFAENQQPCVSMPELRDHIERLLN